MRILSFAGARLSFARASLSFARADLLFARASLLFACANLSFTRANLSFALANLTVGEITETAEIAKDAEWRRGVPVATVGETNTVAKRCWLTRPSGISTLLTEMARSGAAQDKWSQRFRALASDPNPLRVLGELRVLGDFAGLATGKTPTTESPP